MYATYFVLRKDFSTSYVFHFFLSTLSIWTFPSPCHLFSESTFLRQQFPQHCPCSQAPFQSLLWLPHHHLWVNSPFMELLERLIYSTAITVLHNQTPSGCHVRRQGYKMFDGCHSSFWMPNGELSCASISQTQSFYTRILWGIISQRHLPWRFHPKSPILYHSTLFPPQQLPHYLMSASLTSLQPHKDIT